jgi:hypothetical protein
MEFTVLSLWRTLIAFLLAAGAGDRLFEAFEQRRLWAMWRVADPSAADLYQSNSWVAAALAIILLGAAAAFGRSDGLIMGASLPSTSARRRRLSEAALLVAGLAAGGAYHGASRWLAVDRCLDGGGRWLDSALVCTRHG